MPAPPRILEDICDFAAALHLDIEFAGKGGFQ
jgi:hypothetical protein